MALIPLIPECTASTMSTWNFLFQWKIATPIKLCDPSNRCQIISIFPNICIMCIPPHASLTLILGNYFALLKWNTQNVFPFRANVFAWLWVMNFDFLYGSLTRFAYNFVNEYLNQCQFCGIRRKTNCSQSKIHFEYAKHWSTLQWF